MLLRRTKLLTTVSVGQVNKVGEDHIGLLILGIFNASITLEELGKVNFTTKYI